MWNATFSGAVSVDEKLSTWARSGAHAKARNCRECLRRRFRLTWGNARLGTITKEDRLCQSVSRPKDHRLRWMQSRNKRGQRFSARARAFESEQLPHQVPEDLSSYNWCRRRVGCLPPRTLRNWAMEHQLNVPRSHTCRVLNTLKVV